MSLRSSEQARARLTYALAVVLVAAAFALTALRVAVAYTPAFRGELEELLTRRLERPVAISALNARLVGIRPVLILHDVRIGAAPGRQADLAADRLELSIDLWHTLRDLRLRFAGLYADRLVLTLTRLVDGQIVLGRQATRPGGGLYVSISRLRLRDASVTLIDQGRGKIWCLHDLDAAFWRDGGVRHLSARFMPARPRLASEVELAVRWQGWPASLAEVNGAGYLRLGAARLRQIRAVLPSDWGVPAVTGRGDGRFWISLRRGRSARVAVDVSARGLELGAAGAVRFERLSGRARWQRTDNGWKLDINALRLQRPGRAPAPPAAVSVRYATAAEGGALWRARGSSLGLGDFAALMRSNDRLPRKWRELLVRLAPRGEISEVAWIMRVTNQKRRWRASGRFQDLAVQPIGQLPGLTAGDGRFVVTKRGGRLRLDARDTELTLPALFAQPLALQRLRLRSEWRVADGRVRLAIPRLQARSLAGELNARLALWLGAAEGPFIDARAHLQHGKAGEISRYLPRRILPEELSQWLHGAIRGGKVRAELVLRGRTRDFPYRNDEGVFKVQAQVDEVSLAYDPDWPMLRGLGGQLLFHQGAFRAELDRGRIYASKLLAATAEIAELAQPRLEIHCRITGPGDDLVRYLRESPLADEYAGTLRRVSLSGQQQLDLELDFSFAGRPIAANGRIDLDGARLAVENLGLAIEELTGRIHFDEHGVSWDQLHGRFSGHRLVSRAVTSGAPGEKRIRIEARLRASVAELLGAENSLTARLAGTTDWFLAFDGNGFRAAERRLELTLESKLRGVRVSLPKPLAKPRASARLLRIRTRFNAGGAQPIRVHYAQAGSAVFTLRPEQRAVDRLGIHLGNGEARLPRGMGTRLTGTLERVDLAALIGSGSGEEPIGLPRPLHVDNLRVGTLSWANTRLVPGLKIDAKRLAGDWRLHLSGPDVAGWIHWPQQGEGRAQVSLARLHLARLPELGTANEWPRLSTLDVPGINIDIVDLRVGAADFGHLSMRLKRVGDGLVLEAMNLNGPVLEAGAVGRFSASGQHGRSSMDLEVSSNDTGKALALFGFAEAIRNGTASARAQLQWPGTLLNFGLASVTGDVRFTIRDGSLLQVQPGAGRILGLLSVASLPRRLVLDFSDLFGKGLAFDRIKAHFRLENGTAHPKVFYIDSPAARIEVSGPVDLVTRSYNQTVTVMPHISLAVSLLGGLAGGPLAGVVLFVTQTLLQSSIEQLVQARYRITGSWQQPRVKGTGQTGSKVPGVANDAI
ncbi:MAG: TIGR02099 family protein [Nitrococcus sp.]|nr:TIGR02099 family protein [Nitrococcus sp.]